MNEAVATGQTRSSTTPGQAPGAVPPAADRSRWAALIVLCTGMLMIVLDGH